MTRKLLPVLLVGCATLVSCVSPGPVARPELTFLSVKDGRTVMESGEPVVLKGCNLGNWFLLEMWMLDLHGEIRDQHEFEAVLAERFGRERKDALMEVYRANWITERDFRIIPTFGFNAVRLPFDYSLLMDDERPLELKKDAFRWLDAAVDMAARHGLYTILDLHGAPGRQSTDHTTGWADQNKLWNSDEYRKQTTWLWREIAAHYKDNPAVAAYDVINEPFGDYKTSDHAPAMVSLMGELIGAIRAVDPRHIIVLAGTRDGVECYGDPAERGWENVMFTEHYYPGVQGQEPSLQAHREMVNRSLPYNARRLGRMGIPLLVGEFNVVLQQGGGSMLMRQYYDLYASKGWWATMWCYKLVSPRGGLDPKGNWFMVTNAKEAPRVSIRASSYEEIEACFKWFGSAEYAVYDELRQALTTDRPVRLFLEDKPFIMEAPFNDSGGAWSATDVSCRPAGGQQAISESDMDVYGGGRDLWNRHDEFRFVWQKTGADFTFQAVVTNLTEVFPYAKAGLTIRGGLEPDAPHVLLHVFPSSQVMVGWREQKGEAMQERRFPIREFPVHLQWVKSGNQAAASWSADGIHWIDAGTFTFDWLSSECYVGMAVVSHDDRYLAKASFRQIKLTPKEALP